MMGRVYPSVSNKWPFQDHFTSNAIVSTQQAWPPRRPEQTETSPVSLTTCLFKIIFQVILLYQLFEQCVPGDLANENAK